ncbi:hypothetical protein EZV61_05925 [Corallincola luteus]|uniref:TIGR03503 family protein n=1 Tax=Corallincola luteus TaxID=1775177 RepID=A0ABY2AR27_9GAMM|nr:hypothetical protein [Corallincola luteus]TCI05476.1 hypothetical protein EZV61_05925 [Corallincola luteus]
MMLLSFASFADNLSPLLKNRFRLDHGIEEITLVIYRHDGSAPVVLIQPDGSKLYASRHPEESVAWFDDAAFDLITIKKPMAGPWQVVGSVDPRNRMVTMSDVSLVMDALPEELYVGERLRLTARVVNRGQTIALAPFVADLKMEIWARAVGLSSSYDLSYNGLKLGEFIDDGTGFDESPGDGVLTGTLDLNISADQYEMSLRVYNPTFERVTNHSLRLLPSPVTADLVVVEEKPVAIYFQFDGSAVELDNIALSGTIFASDGREREFTLSTQGQDNTQFSLAELTESGDYRMEAEVFGRSVTTGRDMALATNVVRFSVVNLPPTPQERVAEVVGGEAPERVPEAGLGRLMDQIDEEFNRQLFELNQKVNKPQPSVNWWLIAGINLGLLLLAAIMMFVYKWMMLQKTKAAALEAEKSKGPEVEELDEELIDLSLPED